MPLAEGVNVTVIAQVPPAFTLVPQLLVCAKSALLVPVIEILILPTATLPLLLRLIFFAGLVVPTGWFPKLKLVGLNWT